MTQDRLIDKAKWDAVKQRLKLAGATTIGEQWTMMFRELFPEDDFVPSPCKCIAWEIHIVQC